MGNNKICAQKGNNLYSKNRIENYKIIRLLPNYAMNERFLTTKKLYHEQRQFVKRFFKMLQIGAFFVFGEQESDFFSEALDGKIEAVEYILRTVLERNDIVVLETKAQVEYKSAE